MRTRTIGYGDIKLVVSEATTMIGFRRTRYLEEAQAIEDDDPDRALLRRAFAYLKAATVEAEGLSWPLTFEEYLELPEALAIEWEEAVADLNPHWLAVPTEEDIKKKATTSTSGSPKK